MANKLYEESHVQDIANAIREKNGTENTYKVSEMGEAIRSIKGNDGNVYNYVGYTNLVVYGAVCNVGIAEIITN